MPDGHLQHIVQDVTHRKKMEESLRASEEKFAKSFQSSPDAVTISVVDTGKFVEVNEGFCRMSGYTREEALGHSAEELHIWEDVNRRSEMIAILQTEGKVRDFETTLRRRTGESLNCLLTVEAVEIGGQNCMVAITRDITERKRMEQELRLSEERYRLVSSVISDYIYSTVRDENDHWHQNWVAGAFERITGYAVKEFNERGGWLSILHPDDFESDSHAMQKLLNREQTVAEVRIIRKDGTIHWVRSYAHPVWDEKHNRLVEIYGAVQDITEQKRIAQELLLSEERYRLVSSVISDYTFSNVQNEKGEIVLTWVAGAFEQISGYTFEEFNARGGWVSTIHPEDLEQDAQDMEMLRRNQQVISEIRTIHKDGTTRWVKSYAHPV
ncbi:MAG TPA: PAS domain S-box protein, partial [Anaerolineales bacterium]|nr:PAS domain S-box protein [Anaerolineales bacterium]